jgi:DtxR family Mn-dependent transcriptional regulator
MIDSINNKPTAILEDYLEAIAILKEQHRKPTVTALSESIKVKKPSVDWALKKLSDAGLVTHERYGDIDLTLKGSRIANEVYRRHKALYSFLTDILKIDPDIAREDACRMEHSLSRESINRLEKFIDFIMDCHPGRSDWEDIFNRFIAEGKDDREIKARFARES